MARRPTKPATLARRAVLALLTAPLMDPGVASDVAAVQVPAAGRYPLRASTVALGGYRLADSLPAVVVKGWVSVVAIDSDVGLGPGLSGTGSPLQPSSPLDASPQIGVPDLGAEQSGRDVMRLLGRKQFDEALAASNELIRTLPKSPVGYNLQGAAYLGKNDAGKARASFEQALRQQAGYVPALMNLAQLDTRQRNLPAARSRYQAILAADAKNLSAMLGMAQVEAVDGKEPAARDWLERAKRDVPKALAPRLLLAYLDIRAQAYPAAMDELKAARDVAPQNAEVLQLLAHAQGAAGKHADAVETYKALVALQPKSPLALLRLADAHARAGSTNLAEATLKQALQIDPRFVDAMVALAYLQSKASRYAEATQLADKLRKISPSAAAALDGDILAQQRRYRDAGEAYAKAFALAPSSNLAAKLHASRTRSGNAKQADEEIGRWISEHPRDVAVRRYLAAEHIKAGRSREAAAQYEAIIAIDPRNVEALNNLAALYQSAKDPRALPTAEKAFAIAPGSAIVGDTLGWVLVNQGDVARGLPLLRKAAGDEPKNPEIQYHLAFGLAGAGQRGEARRALEALLSSDTQFAQREEAQALLKTL